MREPSVRVAVARDQRQMMVLVLLLCVSTAIVSQASAQTENCSLITESELGSTTAYSNVGVVPTALQSSDGNQGRRKRGGWGGSGRPTFRAN